MNERIEELTLLLMYLNSCDEESLFYDENGNLNKLVTKNAWKGYGIIDDCGGIFGLCNIFNGEDDSWGKHNINEFNLEECNKIVKNRHRL